MLLQGRGLLGPVAQTAEQGPQPLLQSNPVNQTVLLVFQLLLLIGVIESSLLKLFKQILLVLSSLLRIVQVPFAGLEGRSNIPPVLPAPGHHISSGPQRITAKTVEPEALLPGFGQLLGLALHREIDQQGTQIQQLLPVHRHTIQAGPAEKTILLSLLATPLATDSSSTPSRSKSHRPASSAPLR